VPLYGVLRGSFRSCRYQLGEFKLLTIGIKFDCFLFLYSGRGSAPSESSGLGTKKSPSFIIAITAYYLLVELRWFILATIVNFIEMSLQPIAKDIGAEYRKVWGKSDFKAVTQDEREKRNAEVREIADVYFDLTNDNYEDGWGRKLHFSRFQVGESIDAGLTRHEHYMALMGEMKPGMKILDAGCGFGSPARSIASFVGAHVTGITINRAQVFKARGYAEEEGLSNLVDFVEGDFMVYLSNAPRL
jgi:tRNA/tmRNA/rRNA uracil-C5-methylase (TrmA/RlmC/RlmD family)